MILFTSHSKLATESVIINSVVNVTVKLVDTQKRLIKGETANFTVVGIGTFGLIMDNGDGSFAIKYKAPEIIGSAEITAVANNGKFASKTLYFFSSIFNIV